MLSVIITAHDEFILCTECVREDLMNKIEYVAL